MITVLINYPPVLYTFPKCLSHVYLIFLFEYSTYSNSASTSHFDIDVKITNNTRRNSPTAVLALLLKQIPQ